MLQEDRRRAAWDELLCLLREVDGAVDAVIVEGQRDLDALRGLGMSKPIFRCSSYGSLRTDLVEEVAENFLRVFILTDFDEEGRDLNRKLTSILEHRGVKVVKVYRRSVRRLLSELKVSTIESLSKLSREI